VEVILGKERRRWSEDDKRALVAETFVEGETVHGVARRHSVSSSMLFSWRKVITHPLRILLDKGGAA
jgi:transposase